MKIRKQVYALTLEDLGAFPVWEFALDEEGEEGQDEATVRPYTVSGAVDPSDGMLIVRAAFFLADGTKMGGYLTPPADPDDGLGVVQPVIITKRGQVSFWHGRMALNAERLSKCYEQLQKAAAEVFPIKVSTEVELVGPPILAEIPGFLAFVDWTSEKTMILT